MILASCDISELIMLPEADKFLSFQAQPFLQSWFLETVDKPKWPEYVMTCVIISGVEFWRLPGLLTFYISFDYLLGYA